MAEQVLDGATDPATAFAAAAASEPVAPTSTKLDVVELDGHVVLKIIKHCQESMPEVVTGLLLGLDDGAKLEVTACFPSLTDTAEAGEADAYQIDMMKCLRGANVDCYTVGWYQSTFLSSFLTESMIENQFAYQENLENSVCVVYDPLLATQGNLSLRALRLTDSFMTLYRQHKATGNPLKGSDLSMADIYEEIPVRVHNSLLVTGALLDLQPLVETQAAKDDARSGLLSFASEGFLHKNLEFMVECIDDLSAEHNKLQHYHKSVARQKQQQDAFLARREAEKQTRRDAGEDVADDEDLSSNPLFKPIPPPNRLEPLLVSKQIGNQCVQVNGLAAQSLGKVFMVKSLHK